MLYTKFNRSILILLLLWNCPKYFSQQMVSHPLTYYGIGDHLLQNQGVYSAMGRTFVAYFDSTQLNFFNPASYGSLSTGNTLYSIGINERVSTFQQGDTKMVKPLGNIDHIALGFKIKRHFGLAFGLRPFASKGFSMTERVFTGLDSIKNSYQARGYINDVFCGFSYAPISNKSTYLSFGANLSYLFGSVINERTSQLIQGTTASGGLMQDNIHIYSPKIDLGLAFSQIVSDRYKIVLGASYLPTQSFKSDLNNSFYTSNNLNNPSFFDTLYSNNYNGRVTQNQSFSIGISNYIKLLDIKHKTKTLHPNLLVSLQYSQHGTIDYSYDGYTLDTFQLSTRKYAQRFGIGFQYTPETKIQENMATLQFLDKFYYRLGAYYGTLPYTSLSNVSYQDRGLTLGLGIPILVQQSLSSINIAVNGGQRGTFEEGSMIENYISFHLGLTLSPASFERWFRKRKVD